MTDLGDKTIQDFDDQWSRYSDNEGWYGSLELFKDMVEPLLDIDAFAGQKVAEVGSGTGRIASMLLAAGASHVYAIEPAARAFQNLQNNVAEMERPNDVTCINEKGDSWFIDEAVDYAISIGVIQFIPDPEPTLKRMYDSIKPGGKAFLWLYSHEGNGLYLSFIKPLRSLTTRIPHSLLVIIIEVLYGILVLYRYLTRLIPLPLGRYINTVWWPMPKKKRRLVIYDQLNPSYAKYHKRHEAIALLDGAGFENIKIHHRHGYSWCVLGDKPDQASTNDAYM